MIQKCQVALVRLLWPLATKGTILKMFSMSTRDSEATMADELASRDRSIEKLIETKQNFP
jgi:hypothetical protein